MNNIKYKKMFTRFGAVIMIIVGLVLVYFSIVNIEAGAFVLKEKVLENFINVPIWELELEEYCDESDEFKEYDYNNNDFVKNTIVIDAGHGGFDSGAVGKFSGVHEDDINLAVSLMLEKLFVDNGYDVIMTRKDEKAVGSTKQGDMGIRRKIIEDTNPQLTISIHMNYYGNSGVSGPQVFYFENSEEGKKIAQCIQDNLDAKLNPPKKRSIAEARYYLLRSGAAPSVLIECGFLSNKNEEYLLRQESYQQKIANAIYSGAHSYLESENRD